MPYKGNGSRSSSAKRQAQYLMGEAIKHGFKPTGRPGTGRIKRAARKRAAKRRKR